MSEQRRSRSHSAKIVQKSNGNRRKSMKNRSKSKKNRGKFHLRQFWAHGAVSGTRWDTLGMRPGRPKLASGPILERPGRAKSGREPSKRIPGPVPRAPGPRRSGVRARLEYRALSNMITERFLVVFALARGSPDEHFLPVFTMFCLLRAS